MKQIIPGINQKVMRLAWPCVIENLSATMVTLVDTAMVGTLGAVATAAVGVCAPPTWLINGLVQAIGVGGTALVARYIGAKEIHEAEHTTHQVFRLSILFSFLMTLITLLLAPVIPYIMQAKPEVHADARSYLRILSSTYVISFTGMCMGSLLRGAGDTKTPMKAGIIANIVNIVLNFLFIYETREMTLFNTTFTMFGFGMGVKGAALASAIGMGVSGLYLILHMFSKKTVLKLRLSLKEKFDFLIIKKVAKIGTPAALERVAINIGQIVFAAMIASLGTAQMAAYHISINVEGLGYMPAFGFSMAATTLVGQSLGAKKTKEAVAYGYKCTSLSLLLLTLAGALMFIFAHPLASLFNQDQEVIMFAAQFIAIIAFEQPFNAISIVLSGALRGAGDTFMPFFVGLITMWGIRILGAFIFGVVLNLGVYAILWAMVFDLLVRSILLFIRYKKGKWQHRKV